MKRRRNGRFAPECEVPPLCKPVKNAAAVALGNLAAAKAREKRAAWVKRHIEQLRGTM